MTPQEQRERADTIAQEYVHRMVDAIDRKDKAEFEKIAAEYRDRLIKECIEVTSLGG